MHRHGLIKAIKYFGSQSILAKKIGVSQRLISHWLINDKQFPYEKAVEIAYLSNGKISLNELAPSLKEINQLFINGISPNLGDEKMPRIRCTKPEFFKHPGIFDAEQQYQLPMRVAFQALWSCCDRKGRFRWKPRQLKLDMLPYDAVDLEEVLNVLAMEEFIVKYEVNGELYGCIPSWEKHQHINNREPESTLPDVSEGKVIDLKKSSEANTDCSCTCNACVSRQSHVNDVQITSSLPVLNTSSAIVNKEDNFFDIHSDSNQINLSNNNALDDQAMHLNNALATHELHVADASAQNLSLHQRKGKERDREIGKEIKEKHMSNDLVALKTRRVSDLEKIQLVFDHWKSVMDHSNAQLDDKRKKIIRKALQAGYTEDELCEAISGCAKTPYNMGNNEAGQRYDGLQVILRDADQIDRFIHNHHQPPLAGNSERGRNNVHALKNWLVKKAHTIAEGEVYEN